jgi:hypothetical protein
MVVFVANSCVIFQLQLFGQLLPQWGVAVWFWMLLFGSGDQLCNPLPALLWDVACLCVYSLRVWCWDFSPLPCPLFPGQVQCSTHALCCLCLVTVHCFFCSFIGEGYQFAKGLCWFMFLGVDMWVLCGAWHSPVCSANWCTPGLEQVVALCPFENQAICLLHFIINIYYLYKEVSLWHFIHEYNEIWSYHPFITFLILLLLSFS